MAHQSNISVGGHTVPVWEFDSTAQQIDDAVAVLGAPSTPQAALANLGAGVRPNLLDNAYFVGGGTGWGVFPVNQRGQTSYTPVFNGRVMDRWAVEADADLKVTLEPDGILLENTGFSDRQLKQIIPSGILSTGNQYCISALFDLISGSSTVAIGQTESPYGSLGSVSLGTSGFASEVVEPQTDAEWKYIVYVYPGAKVKIKALKLEEGSSQTLAYQKSDGTWAMLPQNLDYHTELAKCQAYLWVPQQKNGHTVLGVGHAENANIAWVTVVPPVSMRTGGTPTVKISDASALNLRGSSIVTATGVSVDQATNGTPILLRVEGTFTPGEALDVFLANSASIEFSREL